MPHTRIKVCGITRVQDAVVAADAGVDAIGLVFYPPSPRFVDTQQAAEIVAALPPFVTVVGLFVNETQEQVERVLQQVPLGLIQFHGEETSHFCRQFARPYIKAIRMKPGLDLAAASSQYSGSRGILLDAWQEGVPGGTGRTFDWQLAHGELSGPMVLAGGLNAGNVGEAIQALHPAAVDVSGGVESRPGIKDAEKVREFVSQVRTNSSY
jgi:phosphoribosylanthranilate isomerase